MSNYTPTTEEVRHIYGNYLDDNVLKWSEAMAGEARKWFDRWLAEHDREVKATERRRIMRKVRSVLGDSGAFGFLGEFEGVLDSIEHEVSK